MFVDFDESSSQAMTMTQNMATAVSESAKNMAKPVALNCITASMDGFVKQFNTLEQRTKKCFFITPSGIVAAANCERKIYALAGMNNDIFIFSFPKQSVI